MLYFDYLQFLLHQFYLLEIHHNIYYGKYLHQLLVNILLLLIFLTLELILNSFSKLRFHFYFQEVFHQKKRFVNFFHLSFRYFQSLNHIHLKYLKVCILKLLNLLVLLQHFVLHLTYLLELEVNHFLQLFLDHIYFSNLQIVLGIIYKHYYKFQVNFFYQDNQYMQFLYLKPYLVSWHLIHILMILINILLNL